MSNWEKRWHPLRREWVVYAAHRNNRPWSFAPMGQPPAAPDYDPGCYLCPGNKRVSGLQNPNYQSVFVFDNDHPVVGPLAPDVEENPNALFKRASAKGLARVICYDPRHQISLSELPPDKVCQVFETWQSQTREMEESSGISSILIFENRGEAVGVSNPHPHCQVYATDFHDPNFVREYAAATLYQRAHARNLFDALVAEELGDGRRILAENEYAVAFVPFFARYAYEVYVMPKSPATKLTELSPEALQGLSAVFHAVVRCYDALFQMPFPYVLAVRQAPVDGGVYPEWRVYLHLQPPLRAPGLVKYLAGPEIGFGAFMADTMPEEKAAALRVARE